MSIRMLDAAFREARVKGTTKLVLLALADHADDEGLCWPGNKRVMEKAGLKSDGALRAQYRKLEEAGILRREAQFREDGSRTSNRYWLELHPPGVNEPDPRLDDAGLEPSIEPTQEVSNGDEVEEVFAHYLAAFPNKRQKQADAGQRKVIRNALEFGTVEELKRCIDANAASDWHQKRGGEANRSGAKHNSLSLILAPKTRGPNYPSGRSQREQIDYWLAREPAPAGPSQKEIDEWNLANARFVNGDGPDPGPSPWEKERE
jgi:hypothetical protein